MNEQQNERRRPPSHAQVREALRPQQRRSAPPTPSRLT
jgi:hypothetical protein